MAEHKKTSQNRPSRRNRWSRRKFAEDLDEIESEVDKYFAGSGDEEAPAPPGISRDEYAKLSPEERAKLKAEMPLPAKIGDMWQDFVVNTGESLQQMQDERYRNYLKRIERVRKRKKVSQNRRVDRIQVREDRINARYERQVREFETANKEVNENLVEMKKTFYEKKAEKRDAIHANRSLRQGKRSEASAVRQKKIQKTMKAVNKWGWRQQLKIVLIILPLLAALVIVFMLLRPFIFG